MDKRKYANHADAVFTVFEMLRNEIAVECDDSAILRRVHEIASLPAADFFAALGDLAAGLPSQVDPSDVLSRCAPLPTTPVICALRSQSFRAMTSSCTFASALGRWSRQTSTQCASCSSAGSSRSSPKEKTGLGESSSASTTRYAGSFGTLFCHTSRS